MRSVLLGILLLALSAIITPSFAESNCTCPGQAIANGQFGGGDGDPLSWLFEVYRVRPPSGQPGSDQSTMHLFCFHEAVTNHATYSVYTVTWDVANYAAAIIPAGRTTPACPQYLTVLAPGPANGPLTFGIGSGSYATTVRAPDRGWKAASGNSGLAVKQGLNWPELYSRFAFSYVSEGGEITTGSVTVASKVALNRTAPGAEASSGEIFYSIRNDSKKPASVFINLSRTEEAAKSSSLRQPFSHH